MSTYDDDHDSRALSTRGAFRHLIEEEIGDRPFMRPPHTITWCPPHGHVVMAPSQDEAQLAAQTFAGKHPGEVVGVYALVGYAHVPLKPAPFTPVGDPTATDDAKVVENPREILE